MFNAHKRYLLNPINGSILFCAVLNVGDWHRSVALLTAFPDTAFTSLMVYTISWMSCVSYVPMKLAVIIIYLLLLLCVCTQYPGCLVFPMCPLNNVMKLSFYDTVPNVLYNIYTYYLRHVLAEISSRILWINCLNNVPSEFHQTTSNVCCRASWPLLRRVYIHILNACRDAITR